MSDQLAVFLVLPSRSHSVPRINSAVGVRSFVAIFTKFDENVACNVRTGLTPGFQPLGELRDRPG